MAGKRSLEVVLKNWNAGDRVAAVGALEDAGIQIAEARQNWIQVRNTTPTEIRRLVKHTGIKIHNIGEGFRR